MNPLISSARSATAPLVCEIDASSVPTAVAVAVVE